jgi:hypothetical protein
VRRVLLFFIPTLLGAPPVRAQTNLGLATGLTMPVSELGRIDNVGFHVSAVVQSSQPLTTFGLRGDLSFNSFARKATIRDVTERIFSITAGPILHPAGLATSYPYAVGERRVRDLHRLHEPCADRLEIGNRSRRECRRRVSICDRRQEHIRRGALSPHPHRRWRALLPAHLRAALLSVIPSAARDLYFDVRIPRCARDGNATPAETPWRS